MQVSLIKPSSSPHHQRGYQKSERVKIRTNIRYSKKSYDSGKVTQESISDCFLQLFHSPILCFNQDDLLFEHFHLPSSDNNNDDYSHYFNIWHIFNSVVLRIHKNILLFDELQMPCNNTSSSSYNYTVSSKNTKWFLIC